jgi:nucleoside-diphosphate-sugar epimerase
MKVLVTGATGFVGRHLVPRLLERGHDVTAVARDETKARSYDWFSNVRFVVCDLHLPLDNPSRLFGHQDAAIHLAWPGLPNYGSLFHFEKNLPAAYLFLKSLIEAGVEHLLVTGTCFEYGVQNGALAETTPTAPSNPYGVAKDTLRKFLELLQRERGFILQWARLFYMHGPGQPSASLLAQLDRAIDNGDTVFNMSGGEQLRDYLPIQTVARRLVSLLEHPQCAGCINICSGTPTSVRNLVERHMAQRGATIELNVGHFPYSDYEPMAFWGVGTKYSVHCRDG